MQSGSESSQVNSSQVNNMWLILTQGVGSQLCVTTVWHFYQPWVGLNVKVYLCVYVCMFVVTTSELFKAV